MSEVLLTFRGEVAATQAGEIVVDARGGSAGGTRLSLSGALSEAALQAARIAAHRVEERALIRTLEHDLRLDQTVARELVAQLLEAGILSAEVQAQGRLAILGDGDTAQALTVELADALWPSELQAIDVVALGTLGSPAFQREVAALRERNRSALTCSFEGDSAWIGPFYEPQRTSERGPCPMCLAARRLAAGAEDHAEVTLSAPPNIALIAALVRQVAEQGARGQWPRGRVLHVHGTHSEWRTLLTQPHCPSCDDEDKKAFRSLSVQSHQISEDFKYILDTTKAEEPSEAQRRAFLDPWLGPLTLELHEAAHTFRDLPLVLGSIRVAERTVNGLHPRLLSSVIFGTGATERRRVLVAYAEGVERYGALTDTPDLTAVPAQELSPFAVLPEQTVRFSEAQYASGVRMRHTQQPLDWSWVYDCIRGEAKLMLHDAVSATRHPERQGVQLFQDPFASGMSAHRTSSLALERSLLELLERDAFMLAWYLQLPLERIAVDHLPCPELRDLLAYLRAAGVQLTFHDLRVDFQVPCVLAVAEAQRDLGPWKKGGKILSACAGLSMRDAVRHALRELLGHYTAFGLVAPDADPSRDPETGEVRCWWPAFAALLSPRADDPLSFLGHGPEKAVADDSIAAAALLEEFRARDLSVFIRRLGRSDIAQSGLVAIRAIVPGLVRLTPTHADVNFGEPRIEQVRARWHARGSLPHGFNPMPHPLA